MRLTLALTFLTVTGLALAQPTVPAGAVVNGASFVNGLPVAPGSLISIFGTGLAARPAAADTVPLSTTLGGVTVEFQTAAGTNIKAPLLYVQSDQVNAIVPWDLLLGEKAATVNVVVTNGSQSSAPVAVKAAEFSPAIFAIGTLAAAQNTDGSLAQPDGSIPGRTTHPAKIGDTVVIYATGLGPVFPAVADGAKPPDGTLVNSLHKPGVLFKGHSAEISFSGLSPQFVGVYQLNVIVPDVVPGDKIPLQLVLGGVASPSAITIAVTQ
jgi:uncharacterized protein (TIGR03437 family)